MGDGWGVWGRCGVWGGRHIPKLIEKFTESKDMTVNETILDTCRGQV